MSFLNNIQIKVQFKNAHKLQEAFWYIITRHLRRTNIFCTSAITRTSLKTSS